MRRGTSLVGLLGDGRERLLQAGLSAVDEPAEIVMVHDVQLRAPVPNPPSIRDFLAFEDHLRNARGEVDPLWYELPIFYFSNPAAVRGPHDEIEMAPGAWNGTTSSSWLPSSVLRGRI